MDNLKTHAISSLYEAFEPSEAFRLAQKLEIHYTPKHGSWLDIAEIELSALTDITALNVELSAWQIQRNSISDCPIAKN